MTDPATIAKGLSQAQRRYLLTVGDHGAPYEPRHGTTANWAIRRGYAETYVGRNGQIKPWNSVPLEERFDAQWRILGQMLTPLGLAVRAILQEQK